MKDCRNTNKDESYVSYFIIKKMDLSESDLVKQFVIIHPMTCRFDLAPLIAAVIFPKALRLFYVSTASRNSPNPGQ